MSQASTRPEFSQLIHQEDLCRLPFRRSMAATAEERQGLAERFGLLSLNGLEADLEIVSAGTSGRFLLNGNLRAEVTQQCVVTLEPVDASIEEPFEIVLGWSPVRGEGDGIDSGEFDPDEDFVEIGAGDGLDLGEMVAQQLSLALDPYPRKPDAHLEKGWRIGPDEAESEDRVSPFSVLRKLRE